MAAQFVLPLLAVSQVHAQPVTIPLQYYAPNNEMGWSLGVNIGVGAGGAPQPYLFDTGSSVFNAFWNPATWGNIGQTVLPGDVPKATVPGGSNVKYCYATPPCYVGNIIQVRDINFYSDTGSTPVATLSATPGYQINAVYQESEKNTFPEYFQTHDKPPLYKTFYGIFGASDFTAVLGSSPVLGGVLGQAIVPGVQHQGFIVSANGQSNPGSNNNPPSGTQTVTIGAQSQQVGPYTAFVTVGLTPQLIGQFAPVSPTGQLGVVPWVQPGSNFPNPYGGSTGNNGSVHDGVNFTTTLPSASGGPPVSYTALTLLDTGTPYYELASGMSGGNTDKDSTLSITGVLQSGSASTGIPTTTSTLTWDGAYQANIKSEATNTLGIPFFMQNSVMFDLTGKVVGYTPFFVTDTALDTTPGTLSISSNNVWLGLAGVISGPNGVTIGQGGAAQLSATNSYQGETKIDSGGMLLISGPGSIQTSSGVTNNGTFDISRAWASVTISSLSGTKTSATVYLGGNNLTIANGNGTYAGDLVDGGAYGVAGGSLTVAGGTQTLAGTNSYTGGTTVTGGTLALTGTMGGSVTIRSGGTFTSTGGYAVASTATLNNAGTFQSIGGAWLLNQGVLLNSGTLDSSLVNNGSFINNGTIVGTLINNGTLSGSGSMTGNMTNDGSLAVNGIITGNVTNDGRLSGNGTITGTVTNNGIVAPGNSIGTLNVVGNFTQSAGGTYQVETNSVGQADRINVSGAPGTATINGGTVTLTSATGVYAPSTTYTIVNATGGVTGTYANANSLYPFLQPSLSYDANNVYLTVRPGGFAAGAATPNQSAVGRVLDQSVAGSSGDLAIVIGTMATYTVSQGQAAMNAISGQNYSGFGTANLGGGLLFLNMMGQQMSAARGTGASRESRTALALACDVACDSEPVSPWSLWGSAMGGTGTVAGNANAGTLTYSAGGVATGVDYRFDPRFLAGIGVGFSTGNQWASGFSGQGSTSSYQASLYGSFTQSAFYVDALAGYGYNDNQMTRSIVLPNLAARLAQGRAGANQLLGQVETGYRLGLYEPAAASITPFARFQGTTVSQSGFSESGAGALNLNVAPQTTGSARSVLGAEFAGAFGSEGREKLAMQLRLGWAHDYASTSRPVTASFAGAPGANFTVFGVAPQRDAATFSLAANTNMARGASLYLRYDGEMGTGTSSHALNGGLRVSW